MSLAERIILGPSDALPPPAVVLSELCGQAPNILGIDRLLLGRAVAEVVKNGLTVDQLVALHQTNLSERNPMLLECLDTVAEEVEPFNLGYVRGFNRGSTLADYLLQRSVHAGAPVTGVLSMKIASAAQTPAAFPTQRLLAAATAALDSQPVLSTAFEISQHGLPEDTDFGAARFGAGVVALYGLATAYLTTHSQRP